MADSTIAGESAAVDWITCSAHEGKPRDLLREYGVELMMRDAAKGNRVGPFRMGRYYGGHTRHVGVAEWGERCLVAIAGGQAEAEYRELLQLADHVSRIDIQVSVRQHPYDADMAINTFLAERQAKAQEGRPPQFDLYARRSAGSTLYLGDGASRFLARLYERWPKTKDEADEDIWRYEVEAKRERAQQMADDLRAAADPDAFIRGRVWSHFARRGVEPIFKVDAPSEALPLSEPEPDKVRSLRWLSHSVRPVLSRLDQWGAGPEARRLLGLEESLEES